VCRRPPLASDKRERHALVEPTQDEPTNASVIGGGTYTDPEPTFAKGREALSKEIARFLTTYPGSRFRCSAPQTHHQSMRFAWLLFRADGTQWTQGMDFGEWAPDGRIRRIVGFCGPLTAGAGEYRSCRDPFLDTPPRKGR
jgi:hypothetical protein